MAIMQITDRSKDVIKSGGEWISTIEIENLAVGHPAVAEAAVIGIAHPKWDERPLLIVVLKPGARGGRKSLLAHLRGQYRQMVAAGRGCVCGRNTAHRHRQNPQNRIAPPLRGF